MAYQVHNQETRPGLKINRSQFLLLSAVGLLGLAVPGSSNPQTLDSIVPDTSPPDRKFFLEVPPESLKLYGVNTRVEALQKILSPQVCEKLAYNEFGFSVATLDLDRQTAEFLQKIQKDFPTIPFALWIATPNEHYYADWENISETEKRTEEALKWKEQYGLENVKAVGFNPEASLEWSRRFYAQDVPGKTAEYAKRMLPIIIKQLTNDPKREEMLTSLKVLFNDIRQQGLSVEGYVLPFPLNLILGTVPLPFGPNDKKFAMIFSSTLPNDDTFKLFAAMNLKPGNRHSPPTYPGLGIYSELGADPGRDFGTPLGVNTGEDLIRDFKGIREIAGKPLYDPLKDWRIYALTGEKSIDSVEKAIKAVA